ncbi:MAG: glycosyltransferase, partial [Promethearchaeota archaeon]
IYNAANILHMIIYPRFKIYFLGARRFLSLFKALFKLRKIIKIENPDILHCFLFHSNILGRFAAIGYGCKVIVSVRNKLIFKKFGNFLDKITQGLVDLYLVNSNTLGNFIYDYGIKKEKIVLIENGVDFENFKSKQPIHKIKKELELPDLPIITTIANYRKQKDYPTLIRAIAYLQKEMDFYFLAIGSRIKYDDEKHRIQILIENLKLKNVKLLDFREDIPEILSVTDVWVSSTLFEGQSNSLLEAMFMKKPIVTTNIPENSEVVRNEHEALLVPIKSPKMLAKAIKRILNDNQLAEKLANNAYERVKKKYNINISLNKLKNLYSSLIIYK